VPVAVVEATVMVIVEVPEPGDAIDAGTKPTVTPVGCPVADNATAELNPPEIPTVTVDVPLLPSATDREAGEAEIVKLGVAAGVTVNVTVVECISPPPAPVTVIGYVPVAVVEATAIDMAEVPEPGDAMDAGTKLTVTPEGSPVAVRATAELNPPEIAVVTVDEPVLPCTTDAEAGDAEMVKSGVPPEPTVNMTMIVWVRVPEFP
jgi:hypothetical protein